jgi:uncharacterized protein YodC (DUF2158 family)
MTGKYRPGDRVRAIEGGPIMLVKGYDDHGKLVCCWYETASGWREATYAERAVKGVGRARSAAR